MNSIQYKTKKLPRLHYSCHGNLITNNLATRDVADALISKNLNSKYKLKTTFKKQGSDFTVVARGTKCIVSNLHSKYELNMTKDKEVL